MAARRTGVAGLDNLLGGGVPEGKAVLLLAAPGCGKTTLCQRFAATTLLGGGKVVYISTNLSFYEFKQAMEAINVSCDPQKCAFVDCVSWSRPGKKPASTNNVRVLESLTDFNEIAREIVMAVKAIGGADAMVLDSISDFVLYSEPKAVFKFLQIIHGEVVKNKAAGMASLEFGIHEASINNTINYIFDGVIEMRPNEKRKLRILRLTGAQHSLKWFEYEINKGAKIVLRSE